MTFALALAADRTPQAARSADKSVAADEVGGFIAIDAKGKVTIYSGKVELGTGAITAITQIAAEELSVPFDARDDDPGRYRSSRPTRGRPTPASRSRTAACRFAGRRPPRARRCSSGLRTSSRWRRTALTVRDGVVTSRTGGEELSYAQLVGERTACDQDRSRGAAEGPEGLHDRGHFRCRASTFPAKIFGTFNFVQDSQAARHAACACRASGRRRGNARTMERRRMQENPRLCPRGSQGQFPGRGGDRRMGRNQGIDHDRRDMVRLGRPARRIQALRLRAQLEDRPHRSVAEHRQCQRGAKAGRPNAAGHLRHDDEHARIDRSILRGRRFQGRLSHGLDPHAGEPSAASATRHHAAAAAGARSLHFYRGRGLLWPQRRR